MKKVLAVNSGSSSFKYKLFSLDNEEVIASGMADRVGLPGSVFTMTLADGSQHDEESDIANQEEAVQKLLSWLKEYNVIDSLEDIAGVGHRVVAGGEEFTDSTVITEDNLWKIYNMSDYAPLHNPAEADGIYAFMKVLPNVPEVAVFDTSFHQSLDPVQYLYSVPYKYYEKFRARKYGAHGTSARYVSRRTADLLNKPVEDLKMVLCHLGSGASVTAIKDGKSFDTSMGFSPVAGITMSTRSGDVDPSLLQFIMKKGKAIKNGDKQAQLTKDIFINRIVRYIGAYMTEMGGLDVLVFTAGIGEHDASVRKQIMDGLTWLGLEYDEEANKANHESVITTPNSKITAMIVPTNEELMIARDVVRLAKLDKLNK